MGKWSMHRNAMWSSEIALIINETRWLCVRLWIHFNCSDAIRKLQRAHNEVIEWEQCGYFEMDRSHSNWHGTRMKIWQIDWLPNDIHTMANSATAHKKSIDFNPLAWLMRSSFSVGDPLVNECMHSHKFESRTCQMAKDEIAISLLSVVVVVVIITVCPNYYLAIRNRYRSINKTNP